MKRVCFAAFFVCCSTSALLGVFSEMDDDSRPIRFVMDEPPLTLDARPLFDVTDNDPTLARWWVVDGDDDTVAALSALGATEISVEPAFEPATIASAPSDDSCPIKTPKYDARQKYLEAIKVEAAWALPGGRGQRVKLVDVEGDWNVKHEDMPNLIHVAGRRQGYGWREHGTAVLGVIGAKENELGMTGIAPDIEQMCTASLGGIGAAKAIHEAAKGLSRGDVLLIELHGPGPNAGGGGQRGYVPMEWWQPEYDAIAWATRNGIVVVEAAGNGGENLDAPVYQRKFDRTVRDSGAILVGAGAPSTYTTQPHRSRLDFSNHGSRVDVQGWGRHVASLDYGDLQKCDRSGDRHYTALFSGTSSASPVVAGSAVLLQGIAKHRHQLLSPREMRQLLVETGQPQTEAEAHPKTQHIGPLPDLAKATEKLVERMDQLASWGRCGTQVRLH